MPKSIGNKRAAKKRPARTRKRKVIDDPLLEATAEIGDSEEEIAEAPSQAALKGETEPKGASPDSRRIRALERRNKELLVRIRELELECMKGHGEDAEPAGGVEDLPEESEGILYIVKNLEAQLDNVFALKEALDADLAGTQAKLVRETTVGNELRARMQLLEARSSLLDQLQDELSFVEEERAETVRKLENKEAQLDRVTTERNLLTEQMVAADARIGGLEQAKVNLEAEVLNLSETVVDLGNIRKDLAQANNAREELIPQVKDLTGRLDASETSRKALELDLTTTKDRVSELQEDLDEEREKLGATQASLAGVRNQQEEQQIENRDLKEAKRRLEGEVKALTAKHEAAGTELEATKRTLHEIHSAATQTTKRIHKRYYDSSKTQKD